MPTTQREERIGDCRLILGDCREVLPAVGRVDVVVTDPPYGVGLGVGNDKRAGHGLARQAYASYEDTPENYREVIVPAVAAALRMSSRGAVFCSRHFGLLPEPDAVGGVYIPASLARSRWGFNQLQHVFFYGTAPGLNAGSRPTVLLSVETAEPCEHPCPKPLGWMTWLVGTSTRPGEAVLDPFMGSGTTGIACTKLGRRFIGIEIEPSYFDLACRRIEAAYREPRLALPEPAARPHQAKLFADAA